MEKQKCMLHYRLCTKNSCIRKMNWEGNLAKGFTFCDGQLALAPKLCRTLLITTGSRQIEPEQLCPGSQLSPFWTDSWFPGANLPETHSLTTGSRQIGPWTNWPRILGPVQGLVCSCSTLEYYCLRKATLLPCSWWVSSPLESPGESRAE